MRTASAPKLFAIVGLSGSGKTLVGRQMAERLGATLFEQDWTLIERVKRSGSSVVHKFDLAEANWYITELLAGRSVSVLSYSQVTSGRDRLIALVPSPIVIVEGMLALHIPVVRDSSTIKFWIQAPLRIAEARQMARWQNEGWLRGLTRAETLQRIQDKRVEEVLTILAQRPSCDWVIDNSNPLQRIRPSIPARSGSLRCR